MSLVPASQQKQQQHQLIQSQEQQQQQQQQRDSRIVSYGGECRIRHGNAFKILQEMSTI